MHCIIVGAGCSGLTCGILLARHGYKVTILEQNRQIAPTVNGFKRGGKYFDTGLHCLGGISQDGSLKTQLELLDIAKKLSFVTSEDDKAFTFCLASGNKWQMPQGFQEVANSLVDLFPSEKHNVISFLVIVEKLSVQFQYGNKIESTELEKLSEKSLRIVLDHYFTSEELKLYLSSLSEIFCDLTSDETSFGFYAASTGSYFHSHGQIVGGGRALIEVMVEQFCHFGGIINTSTKVEKIHLGQHKDFKEVILADGTVVSGDILINTSHPKLLENLLPLKSLRRIQRQFLQSLESTKSIFVVFASCPVELIDKLGSILIYSDNDERPLTFFPSSSNGCGIVALMQASDYQDWQHYDGDEPFIRLAGYEEKKKSLACKLLENLKKHLPALKNIKIESISTPLTIKDQCNAPDGTSYGVKQSIHQYPTMAKLPLRNVFLSGQALAGPGVQGAMTSGFITADTIINQEGIS
ncbi:MAG: FAD-dependent oxidoreductase [Desulfotalea sp.]